MHCRAVAAGPVTAVVAQNPALQRVSLAMHRAATARAKQDWSQRVRVFGPCLAGAPQVAPLDLLACPPGLFVDQGGVETLDELAFDNDLAGVRSIADQVLQDVAGENDRLRCEIMQYLMNWL